MIRKFYLNRGLTKADKTILSGLKKTLPESGVYDRTYILRNSPDPLNNISWMALKSIGECK